MGLKVGDLVKTSYEINLWNRTPDPITSLPTGLPEFVIEKVGYQSTLIILEFSKDNLHSKVLTPGGNIGWVYWNDLSKIS